MNVYDFDGTIYDGDSSMDFYRYCLRKYPKTRLSILNFLFGLVLYMFGMIGKTKFKQKFFRFLRYLPDVDVDVACFWSINESKIKSWYMKQQDKTDIIISASPEFLLVPVCQKLGVKLIASKFDRHTGDCEGKNCLGAEKVRRLSAELTDISAVTAFYSDSLADSPLLDIAPNAYMVKGEKIIPWDFYKPSAAEKAKRVFFTPQFFLFVLCGGCGTIVNFCFSLLFAQSINATIAYAGGYAISLFATYALNALLIFKQKMSVSSFVVFTVSYIPNFIILFALVAIFLNIFYFQEIIVYAGAAILGLPVTFLLVKLFAFKNKTKHDGV